MLVVNCDSRVWSNSNRLCKLPWIGKKKEKWFELHPTESVFCFMIRLARYIISLARHICLGWTSVSVFPSSAPSSGHLRGRMCTAPGIQGISLPQCWNERSCWEQTNWHLHRLYVPYVAVDTRYQKQNKTEWEPTGTQESNVAKERSVQSLKFMRQKGAVCVGFVEIWLVIV